MVWSVLYRTRRRCHVSCGNRGSSISCISNLVTSTVAPKPWSTPGQRQVAGGVLVCSGCERPAVPRPTSPKGAYCAYQALATFYVDERLHFATLDDGGALDSRPHTGGCCAAAPPPTAELPEPHCLCPVPRRAPLRVVPLVLAPSGLLVRGHRRRLAHVVV